MEPGSKVRVRANPQRVGTVSDQTDGSGARLKLLVDFPDGEEFILASSLEKVERSGPPGPDALVRSGRYGRVHDLRGAITYYRLTGRLANLLYSLNTTDTEFLPYQFKPVLQFLESPVKGLVIADEVGLGKTIEAGLIWTELRAREDARRLLVVCPAMLTEKWRDELSSRFGVRAEVVNATQLKARLARAGENPRAEFALVCSMQGLRPPRDWDQSDGPQTPTAKLARFLRDAEVEDELIDLTVIDEAHYLRNPSTLTNQLARVLRPVSEYLVMLSATPIQIGSRDLFSLLHVLDPDTFQHEQLFDYTLQANAPLVKLRDAILRGPVSQESFVAALEEVRGSDLFADNEQIRYLLEEPPTMDDLSDPGQRSTLSEQLDRINPLAKVVTRTLKRDVQTKRPTRDPNAIRVHMSPDERNFYDRMSHSIREYCEQQEVSEGFLLTLPQRQMASSVPAALNHWLERGEHAGMFDAEEAEELDPGWGDDAAGNEVAPPSEFMQHIVREASAAGDPGVLEKQDSKYRKLVVALKKYWKTYPRSKVVLFSYFKKTLNYLAARLAREGVQACVLYGGMDKQEVLRDFQDPEGPDLLLSSEVAAEGVDLQFSSVLINYDLPWNPAKVEQRIGRIDRIGQHAERILIWNFLYADTVDERIHDRLHARLDIFRQALGSMEAMLGDKISGLSATLLTHDLSAKQQEEKIEQAALAIQNEKRQRAVLEEQATHLIAHSEFIQKKVQAAQDLGRYIQGADLLAYVSDFMDREYPGTRFIGSAHDPLEVTAELAVDARADFVRFIEQEELRGTTRLFDHHPPRLKFENRVAHREAKLEVVSQGHPLVRFVTAGLRNRGGVSPYSSVSAIQIDAARIEHRLKGTWAYLVSRWSVEGVRTIERLEYLLLPLESDDVVDSDTAELVLNTAALHGDDWLGAANLVPNDLAADRIEDCRHENERRFTRFRAMQDRENGDRIRMMVNALMAHRQSTERKIRERIEGLRASGNQKKARMIPAEEGKITKLNRKMDYRIAELKAKDQVWGDNREVSAGLLRIVD